MRTITINGVDFELNNITYEDVKNEMQYLYKYSYNGIYGAYFRPSRYKVDVYEEWEEWARTCHEENFYIGNIYVTRPTAQHFSIEALIYDGNFELRGYIWVTKLHNRVYLCDID